MSVKFTENTEAVVELMKSAIKEALDEIGIVAVTEIQSNAPVDTGILRWSYTYVTEDFKVIVGTDIDYSIYVEFKPVNRGGRPHFRSSLELCKSKFTRILNAKLRSI